MSVACPLCGNPGSAEWVEKFGVCDPCAEHIANAFSYHRCGRWLTKDNTPSGGARKAVIGQQLRTQVFERDAYRCVVCCAYRDLTADHIKPESKGGETSFANLQTMCRSCNSRKGVRE